MKLLLAGFLVALVLLVPGIGAEEKTEEASSETGKPSLLDGALEVAGLRRTDLRIAPDLVEVDPFRRAVVSRLLEEPLEMPGYARGLARALRTQTSLLGMFQLVLAQERIDISRPGRRFDVDGKIRYPSSSLEDLVAMTVSAGHPDATPDGANLAAMRKKDPSLLAEARGLYGGSSGEPDLDEILWSLGSRKFLDRAAAFDREALARICEESLGRYELLAAVLSILPEDLLANEFTRLVEIGCLRVIIGGTGDDVHTGEADLVIDVGGDDVYRDLRGRGTTTVIIDVSGRDTYVSSGDRGPGSAEMGFSMVVDLAGDDVYRGGDRALACGLFGLGVIDDRGGNDVYECGEIGLGAGVFGWGLLVDRSGNDVYVGRKFCQGFAGVDGFGALVDLAGNDVYVAGGKSGDPREKGVTQSLSQGFAYGLRPFASGGIALLLDAGGNDAYEGDYFAQGSSYWFALGALVDLGGNDRYAARRYSGGAGIHLSLGVLVDEAGNDAYAMGFGVGLGCGHDYAHGILLDMAGDDSYQAAWLCLGAGNANGVGIFCDVAGNDAYRATTKSLGWGTFDKKREAGSVGVFLDGAGTDVYTGPGVDGRSWSHGRHGAGLDGAGGDPFPAVDVVKWLAALPMRPAVKATFFMRALDNDLLVSGPPRLRHADLERVLGLLGRFEPGLEAKKKAARAELKKLVGEFPEAACFYLDSSNVMVVNELHRAFQAVGDSTVPALAVAAGSPLRNRIRAQALRVLRGMKGVAAETSLGDVLPRVLGADSGGLRREALAAALRTVSDDAKARAEIVRHLTDPDVRIRTAAARVAGAWAIEDAREALTRMRDDPYRVARDAAGEALVLLDREEAR